MKGWLTMNGFTSSTSRTSKLGQYLVGSITNDLEKVYKILI